MRFWAICFLLLCAGGCTGQRRAEVRTGSSEDGMGKTLMITDEQLSAALETGGAIVLVLVTGVEKQHVGTRSEQTAYRLEVVKVLRGSAQSPLEFNEYGDPRLEKGKHYLITLVEDPLFGWAMPAFLPAGEQDQDSLVKAHLKRLESIEAGRQPEK